MHDRAAAWAVLAGAGTTTMAFNIWHATHAGMQPALAWFEGAAPVALAMGLSHIVAAYRSGRLMKIITFAVMAAAMVLSARATGGVVEPATGSLWWLFGGTVDAAALVALQVILSPESRAAARAARRATAGAAGEAAPGAIQEPPERPSQEPAPAPSARPSQGPQRTAVRVSKEPEAERARAAYRKSARQGDPLSDRALGEMFGRSRSWGAARIREANVVTMERKTS